CRASAPPWVNGGHARTFGSSRQVPRVTFSASRIARPAIRSRTSAVLRLVAQLLEQRVGAPGFVDEFADSALEAEHGEGQQYPRDEQGDPCKGREDDQPTADLWRHA